MAGLERFQIPRSLSASTRSALLVGVGVRVANTNNASAPGRPAVCSYSHSVPTRDSRQFRRFEGLLSIISPLNHLTALRNGV